MMSLRPTPKQWSRYTMTTYMYKYENTENNLPVETQCLFM